MAGTALREILAEYGFNIDTTNIAAADSLVDGMGDKLLSFGKWVAGAFAVKAVVDFTKGLIDTADNLSDTSQRLNVGTDDLQAWYYAAKLNGVEADELNSSIQRLGASLADAAKGGGQAKAFKDLGVDLENTDGSLKSSIQVFEEAGVAIGAIADPTKAAGYAADLFGKQYARLLPLFKQGPEGIAKLKKEFQELGGGLSVDFIQNAAEFNDQIDTLSIAGRGLASEVLAPMLPILVDLGKAGVGFARALTGTSKASDTLSLLGRSLGNIVRTFLRGGPATSAFSAGLRLGGKFARLLVQPLLEIEDFLVFLAGGDSVLGDWVDETFGAGTRAKIQRAFQTFADGLDRTEYSVRELVTMFVGLGISAVSTSNKVKSAFLAIPLAIGVAFEQMWNSILDNAADAIVRLGRLIKAIPGYQQSGDMLEGAGENLKGQKSHQAAGAAAQAQANAVLDQAKLSAFARQFSQTMGLGAKPTAGVDPAAAAQAQANAVLALAQATVAAQKSSHAPGAPGATAAAQASGPPTWLIEGIKVDAKTVVNVPPGTDAETAKGVGDASNAGTRRAVNDLSATLAAATPG